jgi:hypothetical protein
MEPRDKLPLRFLQTDGCLADDEQLALYCGLRTFVASVAFQIHAADETVN